MLTGSRNIIVINSLRIMLTWYKNIININSRNIYLDLHHENIGQRRYVLYSSKAFQVRDELTWFIFSKVLSKRFAPLITQVLEKEITWTIPIARFKSKALQGQCVLAGTYLVVRRRVFTRRILSTNSAGTSGQSE